MQELSRRVRSCLWLHDELPASPAAEALSLWGLMLQNQAWRQVWRRAPLALSFVCNGCLPRCKAPAGQFIAVCCQRVCIISLQAA